MTDSIVINFQRIRDNIFDIGRKVKMVEELILETHHNSKSSLIEAGPCNKIYEGYKTFKHDVSMERMDVEGLMSNKISIGIDSSESDLDNSHYSEESQEIESIEFHDTTSMISADHTTECDVVDIEIIEENNNYPNDNLDYKKKKIDPLPGCRKNLDKKIYGKLEEEATEILSLLPHMKYQKIFATLCKNHYAENRILLTLWDLLPSKRPKTQFSHIKKVVSNNAVKIDGTILRIQDTNEDIEILSNNNLENELTDAFDIKLPERRKKEVFQHEIAPPIQNKILQSRKLQFNKNSSAITHPLKNVLRCTRKYDDNESRHRTPFSVSSEFQQGSTNNFKECMNKYMKYLRFVQNAKTKNWKKFSFSDRYDVRQSFLYPHFKKSCMKSSQFIHKNNKLEVPNFVNTPMLKYDSYLQNSSDDLSYNHLVSHQYTPGAITKIRNFVQGNSNSNKGKKSQTAATIAAESSIQTFEGMKRNKPIQEEIVLTSSDKEIFHSLKSKFPKIDEIYLKGLCLQFSVLYNDPIQMTEALIKHIIEDTDQWPIEKDNESVQKEQQVATLLNMFPQADETYLRKMVQGMKNDERAVTDYIEAQCTKPTYITKEEAIRRIKIRSQHKKYAQSFDIKMFLEVFPNPFQHFENPDRQCKFNDDAFKFLKSRFSCIKEDILQRCYEFYKYNLTLSAQALESNKEEGSTMEHNPSMVDYAFIAYDSIPLLQECAFITHKVKIRDYMNKIKKEETEEYEKLKCNNGLWQCECCYDEECMPSQCFTCSDGHIFCKSCIRKGIETRLAAGDARITCFLTCKGEFSYSSLEKALSQTEFSFLLSKKQEGEVMAAGIEGLVTCPFCPYASIPPSKEKIFRCLNPECMKESCRLCKKLSHVPLKCYSENNEKARLLLEEKMTEALVRKCKNCSRPYLKTSGCNKITCDCGVLMCYICDKQIRGYDHFQNSGCPLTSDDYTLHNDTVNAVAHATVEYIAKKDPNVQIDALTILPSKKSTNLDANVTKRVNQVAKFDT